MLGIVTLGSLEENFLQHPPAEPNFTYISYKNTSQEQKTAKVDHLLNHLT
jgi:hypothetical protein